MLALTEARHPDGFARFRGLRRAGRTLKLSVNVPASAFVKLPIVQMLREERPSAGNCPASFSNDRG